PMFSNLRSLMQSVRSPAGGSAASKLSTITRTRRTTRWSRYWPGPATISAAIWGITDRPARRAGCGSPPCLCARGAITRSAGRAISRPARIRPARISGASSRRRAARRRARPLLRFFEQADDLRVFGLPEIAVMRAHRIEGVGGREADDIVAFGPERGETFRRRHRHRGDEPRRIVAREATEPSLARGA